MASSLDVSNGLRRDVPLSRVARLRNMFQLGAPLPVEEIETKPQENRLSEPVAFLSEAFQPEPSTYQLPVTIDSAPDGVAAPEVHIQRFRKNRDLFEKLAQPQPTRVQQPLPSPPTIVPGLQALSPGDSIMPLFPSGPTSPAENLTTSLHSQPSPPHAARPPPPPVPAKPKIAKKPLPQQQILNSAITPAPPVFTPISSQKETDASSPPEIQTTQLANNVSASNSEPVPILPAPSTEPRVELESNGVSLSSTQSNETGVLSSSEPLPQPLTPPLPAEQPPAIDMTDANLPAPQPPEPIDNPRSPSPPAPQVDQPASTPVLTAEVESASVPPSLPSEECVVPSGQPETLDQLTPSAPSETPEFPSALDTNAIAQPSVDASISNETIDGGGGEGDETMEKPPAEEGDEDDSLDASSLEEESPPRRPSGATEEGTYELEDSDPLNASLDVHPLSDGNFWYERPGPPRDEEHEKVSNIVRFNSAPQRVYTTYSPDDYDRFESCHEFISLLIR